MRASALGVLLLLSASLCLPARVLRVDDANILQPNASGDFAPPPDAGEPPEIDFRVVVGYDYRPCYRSYWSDVHPPAQ